jgi:hypothetical protein
MIIQGFVNAIRGWKQDNEGFSDHYPVSIKL